ncbi:DMT family transporter [Spongiimicrobium salis]|uniref:DMT family transporter n=1 Tax=Spongiimicrobium salis TaxID=1667022 RepID=UPI00374D925A
MSRRNLALLAALGATTIYGLNHSIAKGVMPTHIRPFGFILVRVVGASILFWLASLFVPKEKIERKDWGRMVLATLFGMVINMLAFFKGLELSTPINSSVLVTMTPIIVVVLSALLIKEKIYWRRGSGIVIGLIGAVFLILYGNEIRQDAPNIPLGNTLFLLNATFFGLYLITIKKLTTKYHPFTLMKWLFLIAIPFNLPIGYQEFMAVDWGNLPFDAIWKIAFVVLGTTFCTYLFNIFALRELKASTVSAFTYLQPVLGILFAILAGQDQLTSIKVIAVCFVLLGVYLASRKPKASPMNS